MRWRREEKDARARAIHEAGEIEDGYVDFDREAFHTDARWTSSGWRLPQPVFDAVADRFLFLRDHDIPIDKGRIAALADKAYKEFVADHAAEGEGESADAFCASDIPTSGSAASWRRWS